MMIFYLLVLCYTLSCATAELNPTKLSNQIINDFSWKVKMLLMNNNRKQQDTKDHPEMRNNEMEVHVDKIKALTVIQDHERTVGIEGLVKSDNNQPRRVHVGSFIETLDDNAPPNYNDEEIMRQRLFRLMYEAVRDCELKAQRAELIRTHYTNNTAFDVGYMLSDVTDKFNVMLEISRTIDRMTEVWTPLEHINAYEQVSTQAVEINHIIDLVLHSKKDEDVDGSGLLMD